MPRRPVIKSRELPYHVYGRTNRKEWFEAPLDLVWKIFCEECFAISVAYGARVHALVVMVNHYHLVISSPDHDLGKVMCELLKTVSRRLNDATAVEGHLFGGPYRATLITSDRQYADTLKYVYRNPVKARAVELVEHYPFSTLSGVVGQSPLLIPLYYPFNSIFYANGSDDPGDQLSWLNQPFENERNRAIAKALKKRVFKMPARWS